MGIEVFLVLLESDKDVCYLEYREIEEIKDANNGIIMTNGIMMTWKDNKYGISLKGKFEEKELLATKLLNNHKKTLRKRAKRIR